MSGHTPGPWRTGDDPLDIVRSTSADEYRVIATVTDRAIEGTPAEAAANAQFIVTAVNCHADLLQILRAASHALRSYQHGNASPDLAAEVADAVDYRIAKAEGRG